MTSTTHFYPDPSQRGAQKNIRVCTSDVFLEDWHALSPLLFGSVASHLSGSSYQSCVIALSGTQPRAAVVESGETAGTARQGDERRAR